MLSVFLVVAIVEMTHSLYIKKNTIFNIKSEHLAKGEQQYDKSVTDFFRRLDDFLVCLYVSVRVHRLFNINDTVMMRAKRTTKYTKNTKQTEMKSLNFVAEQLYQHMYIH